ncbi:MAG: hypothetical protein J6Y37_10895 [Paludibacteraceae bacterium]|nr:hypothetical protein [Paludibacteraceae bacterium]
MIEIINRIKMEVLGFARMGKHKRHLFACGLVASLVIGYFHGYIVTAFLAGFLVLALELFRVYLPPRKFTFFGREWQVPDITAIGDVIHDGEFLKYNDFDVKDGYASMSGVAVGLVIKLCVALFKFLFTII